MIVKPLDLSDDKERGFVMSCFAARTGTTARYLRELMRAGARVMVCRAPTATRSDGKPILYGWMAEFAGKLVHCYVVHDYRSFPVLPRLMDALGLDLTQPTVVMFPTIGVDMAARQFGWQLIHAGDKGPEKGAA